jgi:peptidoglycan/LPS O-acetylase OafA/YrhL
MGAGLILPVFVNWLERDQLTGLGIGFIAAGCGLISCGPAVAFLGFRQRGDRMPSGVRAAVAANALILAFLALELSDRAVRQDGKLFYWTTFLLPPALILFVGLVAAHRWSWWAARGIAVLGVIWFLGFLVVIPFAPLQADGVPAPWYGRLYVAGVTLAFTGIFGGAFRALGQPETRSYFGIVRPG